MPSLSLVIFDCDGVLVDSERLSHSVLKEMIAEHGVTLTLEQTLDHFMGTSTQRCLDVLASLIRRPAPADFLERFRVRCFAAFSTSLIAVPGVAKVLEELETPYCVASNGPREKMLFTLGRTGLLRHFEGRLFSAEDVRRPKPAPDLFLHAAEQLNVRAQDCLVIEDSPTGVAAARSAGMRVLGFAGMGQAEELLQAGAGIIFDRMSELPALIAASS